MRLLDSAGNRATNRLACAALFLAASTAASLAGAEDWPRFLGPSGSSVSSDSTPPPDSWGDDKNVKWKADLTGRGVSCPIVVAGKVFVTSYSGYGTGGENENIEDLKRHVSCFDAVTGESLWSKTVDAVQPEDPYRPPGVTSHGYASHTPVSDGKHVFVFFGKTGVICFDLDGNEVWRESVGTGSGPQAWGSAASPILYQKGEQTLVIVNASEESESMIALDGASGKEVWKTTAGGLQSTWSTPTIAKVGDRSDLVITVPGEVWGLNPDTGKLRWYSRGTTDNSTSASPLVVDGVVFAIGGRSGDAVAVKAGGKGDVNDSHVVWDSNIAGRFASPVAHEGHLYVYSGGILSCYDAATGERVKQQRLSQAGGSSRGGGRGGDGGRGGFGAGGRGGDGQPGGGARGGGPPGGGPPQGGPGGFGGGGRGGFGGGGRGGFGGGGRGGRGGGMGGGDYATPVISGEKIYVVDSSGTFYVVEANPEMKVVATNQLTDTTGFSASPAISDGRLFLRSGSALYCISE